MLSDGLDKTHYGYKGGAFMMSGDQVPYIDNEGECNLMSIYDFEVNEDILYLKTETTEY